MDTKRKNSKRVARVLVYVDVMLLLILTLITMINPPIDPTVELRPKVIITAEWDGELRSDVDVHIIDPSGLHMSYSNKDLAGRIVLHRDDTGVSRSLDGSVINLNLEVVDIFSLDPGSYKVAVRMYSKRDNGSVDVHMRMLSTESYDVFVDSVYTFTMNRQTISVFAFNVTDKGRIVDINFNPTYKLPSGEI